MTKPAWFIMELHTHLALNSEKLKETLVVAGGAGARSGPQWASRSAPTCRTHQGPWSSTPTFRGQTITSASLSPFKSCLRVLCLIVTWTYTGKGTMRTVFQFRELNKATHETSPLSSLEWDYKDNCYNNSKFSLILGLAPHLEALEFPENLLQSLIRLPKFGDGEVNTMGDPYRKWIEIKDPKWELLEIKLVVMSSIA